MSSLLPSSSLRTPEFMLFYYFMLISSSLWMCIAGGSLFPYVFSLIFSNMWHARNFLFLSLLQLLKTLFFNETQNPLAWAFNFLCAVSSSYVCIIVSSFQWIFHRYICQVNQNPRMHLLLRSKLVLNLVYNGPFVCNYLDMEVIHTCIRIITFVCVV